MRNITRKAPLKALLAFWAFAGCSQEHQIPFTNESKEVVFHINIPGGSTPNTRGLSEMDENEVVSIEMLLFDPASKEVVYNPVFANEITSDPEGQGAFAKKSFSVRLPQGVYDVMVFANARAAFGRAGISIGALQEETLAKLKAWMPSGGWDSNLIPMWGMKEKVPVGEGSAITGIYLHRMLSRIDLNVTGAASETGDFKIKNIKLYNVQKEGRIAPMLANWNKSGMINGAVAAGLAMAPSTVTGCGVYSSIGYVSKIAHDHKSCVGEIYLFEAPKAHLHADPNAPFLTVQGEFNGVEGWYRIDLADYATMSYLPVLRNHLYRININKVTGTGFPIEEDAVKNRGDNIVVDISLWNEFDLGGTVFDGQHYLSINPQDIALSEEDHPNNILTIKTDIEAQLLPSGIKVSGSATNPHEAINWIQTGSLSAKSVVNGKNVYTLTYSVEANDGDARTGYIYVTLGRLTHIVRIHQAEGGDTMTVPDYLVLGPTEQRPVLHQRLSVTCLKRNGDPNPHAPWSLTIPQHIEWLKMSLTSDYQTAGKVVSGTGSTHVYLFVDSNILGSDAREATVTLSAKGVDVDYCVVRQSKDTPPSQSVSARASCVGAFWRHDQIGERIVQINMGAHSGGWMASVTLYDDKWNPDGGDGVLLAMSGSSDPHVGKEGVNPGDAEVYPLVGSGYSSSISGTVSANEDITFRIGLEKKFTAFHSENNPARYAVIELWYADFTRMQRIYLRQGEGADYLMHRFAPDNRPLARKISPYNLTAGQLNAQAGLNGANPNPGKFVPYPTQAGAFFQFSSSNNLRYAWDPFTVKGVDLNRTWEGSHSAVWGADQESCPSGYHRPSDNPSNANDSELRQSLWLNPQAGDDDNRTNYLYGYYADGFYDRRPLHKYGAGSTSSVGVAAKDGLEVAYGGGLFYNPKTHASIFFPVAGGRSGGSGDLSLMGYWGYYLSTYIDSYLNAYALTMQNEGYLGVAKVMKVQGCNIRCMK